MDPLVLIAGFGSIGRRHFRNLRAAGVRRFVFLRSGHGAADPEIAIYPTFRDVDAAMAVGPDIAVVANPTALHIPVALAAARAGAHLFLEKPVSHDRAGCEELAAIADAAGLVTMVGFQFRFHPLLVVLRNGILSGGLGSAVSARAEYGEYLPGWHPGEDHRQGYSAREDLGGGVVLTLTHPLDYLYWLFGPVGRVHGSMRRIGSLETRTSDDVAEIVLEFQSGVIGQVHLDYIQRPPVHTLTVVGDRGRATLNFLSGELTWIDGDGARRVQTVPEGFERNSMFRDEMTNFLAAVAERRRSAIPLREGIDVLDLALRAKADALEATA